MNEEKMPLTHEQAAELAENENRLIPKPKSKKQRIIQIVGIVAFVIVNAVVTAVGCAVHMLFTLATLALTVEGFTVGRGMTEAVLPELLSSMVFAALPHLLAKAALRVFHKPREEKVE